MSCGLEGILCCVNGKIVCCDLDHKAQKWEGKPDFKNKCCGKDCCATECFSGSCGLNAMTGGRINGSILCANLICEFPPSRILTVACITCCAPAHDDTGCKWMGCGLCGCPGEACCKCCGKPKFGATLEELIEKDPAKAQVHAADEKGQAL